MKPTYSSKKNHGLTLIEFIVVLFAIAILAAMLVPASTGGSGKAEKIYCAYNLKQVGLAHRIWAGDHHDKYPMQFSVTNGGTMEWMNGPDAWRTYQVMSNELSTPKILYCPRDGAHASYATNFGDDLKNKISYFIGVDAITNLSQAFLSGDDNFEIGGKPVESGLITVNSNTAIEWDASRHLVLKSEFWIPTRSGGNILHADGSIQWSTNTNLISLFQQSGLATNRLAVP